jgi:fumarylacetoacetase
MEAEAALKSFIEYGSDHPFPLENIPYGAFTNPETNEIHCCTRIGDHIVDLAILHDLGHFSGDNLTANNVFKNTHLNAFMALGKSAWSEARHTIQNLFAEGSSFKDDSDAHSKCLFNPDKVQLTMPVFIRDYTDFYSSKNHAYNVGCIVRGPDNALQPNWSHLPVGYHGRASSIVISGADVRRPKGQVSADKVTPTWSDCKRLDFELEMGAYIGVGNEMGTPIKVSKAADHIFGLCLLNDWSARDIQVWEYVPLGPFGAKNFSSTISPWIITLEALEPFKVNLPEQDPEPLPYLKEDQPYSFDIELTIGIKSETMKEPHTVSVSNFKHLYWSINQQLTHHAVTGCNMSTGDLLGSGTISGTQKSEYGSMLELSWAGKEKVSLGNDEERVFLKDGDTVYMSGACKGNGYTIGFGECAGKVLPALDDKEFF